MKVLQARLLEKARAERGGHRRRAKPVNRGRV